MAKVKEENKNVVDELDLDIESTKEEAKSGGEWTGVNTGISKYWIEEVEKPEYASLLVELKRALPCKIHNFTKSDGLRICLKSKILGGDESTDCKYCKEKTIYKDKKGNLKDNYPSNSLVIPGYIYDRVGKTYEKEIDGQKKEFDERPEKIIIINRCAGDTNITQIKDMNEMGVLTECLFELRKYKKEEKKAMTCIPADRMIISKKFAHLGGCNVPEEIKAKWDAMTKAEVWGYCINVLNPDWENETVKKYIVKPKENKKEETELSDDLDG